MVRTVQFALAGVLSVGLVSSAWAQASGGATGGAQGTTGAQGTAGAQGSARGTFGIGQTPWFSNPTVRSQLNLNDQQFNALNQAYGQAYNQFQTGTGQIGQTVNGDQRTQKMQDLQNRFNQSFNSAVQKTITDPQQQQRFGQLYLQYQGVGAFNDPTVQQKLNLTDEQRQKLSQLGNQWNTQMQTYSGQWKNDTEGKRWGEMRKQYNDRINSILNDQQQQTWRQMTGNQFEFQPSIYFQNGTSGSGSSSPNSNK